MNKLLKSLYSKIGDNIKGTKIMHICCFQDEIKKIRPKRLVLTSLLCNKKFRKIYCQQGLYCLSKCPYSYTNSKIEKK